MSNGYTGESFHGKEKDSPVTLEMNIILIGK